MFDHPLNGKADLADPEFARLVVARMHRHPQSVRIEREDAADELPRPSDSILFSVAAEAEIAEHLEQRMMPRRIADVLKIVVLAAGAHT